MKPIYQFIILIFLMVIFAGCVSPFFVPQQYLNLTTHTGTNQFYSQSSANNKYSIGQIVFQHRFTREGNLIVNVNNTTRNYELLDVFLDASGNGWHTNGKEEIILANISDVDYFNTYSWDAKVDPIHIPDGDLSIETPETYVQQNQDSLCDLAIRKCKCAIIGSWVRTDGDDIYVMYSSQRAITTHSNGQIVIGDWNLNEGTNYTIYWHLPQPFGHRDFYDNITISPDCYSFSGRSNHGEIIHAHRM